MTPNVRQNCMALTWYFIIGAVMTGSVLANPQPCYLGAAQSDLYKHVWGHWFVTSSLTNPLQWPIATRLLNFPRGGTLFIIDPFNCVASGLLGLFVPRHTAHNLLILGQLVFNGWAAWRLAFHVSGNFGGALAAGTLSAFSPWVMSYSIASGVSETLGFGWVALSALYVLKCVEGDVGGWGNAVRCGLCLAMAGFNSWYFLLFSLLIGIYLIAAARLLGRNVRAWTLVGQAALAVSLATVLLFPLGARFFASFNPATSIEPAIQERVEFNTSIERALDYFTVSDFVMPGKDRLSVSRVVEQLCQTPYVGLLGLALAALSLKRRDAAVRTWAWGALLFFVLSLGPAVCFTSTLRSSGASNVVFYLAYRLFGFWLITSPFRVHALTMLCLGNLCALALARYNCRVLPGALVSALLAFETCWLSPAPFPLPVAPAEPSSAYQTLKVGPNEGVLDLPPLRYESELSPGEYYVEQIVHRAGIPYTTGGIFNEALSDNPFFCEMWRMSLGVWPPTTCPLEAGNGLSDMIETGYRYVVLHGDNLPPRAFHYTAQTLTRWLGEPVICDGSTVIYAMQLPTGTSAPGSK